MIDWIFEIPMGGRSASTQPLSSIFTKPLVLCSNHREVLKLNELVGAYRAVRQADFYIYSLL
jgi:hypothetical protein